MKIIKILISLTIALMCIIYASQNIMNIDQALGAVGYVMSNAEHEVYPKSVGPAITNPGLVWAAIITIIAGEFLAGLLALKGTWDMWSARNASAMEFDSSKKFTYLGAGVGFLVWGGLFHVVAGAFFQMWQTAAGDMSLSGAFWLLGICVLGALFIAAVPDD